MKTAAARVLVTILCSLAVWSSLHAQTIERSLNVAGLGYEAHNLQLVDADGNPATEEWLAMPTTETGAYQVIAVSTSGAICTGPWFYPTAGLASAGVIVRRLGLRDVLLVREHYVFSRGPVLRVVGLTRPPC